LRALAALGLSDRCAARGFGYSQFIACDADGNVTGTVEARPLLGPDYPATLGIMRPALQTTLQEAIEEAGIAVRMGVTVASFDNEPDGVTVRFTDGTHGTYALVVGADGANSKMRAMLLGDEHRPRYTGQAAWRALVPRPPHVRARHSFYGPRNKAGVNPVSCELMYVYLQQNLPEFVRIPDARLPNVLREQLTDFGGFLAVAREAIHDPSKIVYRPTMVHLQPAPWYRHRVVLIGDAVHVAPPQLASGATIALEDALVLARLLQSGKPLPVLLDEFMSQRFERCRMVVEGATQLGEWEKNPGAAGADPVSLVGRAYKALAQPF
jgi:2-polyprenyl-6-methoxyphenol hydroxylase-like FAD-dependent oxidoreductase